VKYENPIGESRWDFAAEMNLRFFLIHKPPVTKLQLKNDNMSVETFLKVFKKIEIAVYCSSKDRKNYETFSRVLG